MMNESSSVKESLLSDIRFLRYVLKAGSRADITNDTFGVFELNHVTMIWFAVRYRPSKMFPLQHHWTTSHWSFNQTCILFLPFGIYHVDVFFCEIFWQMCIFHSPSSLIYYLLYSRVHSVPIFLSSPSVFCLLLPHFVLDFM